MTLCVFLPSFGSTFSCTEHTHTLRVTFEYQSCQVATVVDTIFSSVYLLSGAVRMIQVDRHLTLTSAERVHCEDSGTHHSVPCGLDALKRTDTGQSSDDPILENATSTG